MTEPLLLKEGLKASYKAVPEASAHSEVFEEILASGQVSEMAIEELAKSQYDEKGWRSEWTHHLGSIMGSTPAFKSISPWVRADGSPLGGDEKRLRLQVGLGSWAIILVDGQLDRLDAEFRRQLMQACYFLVVRNFGHQNSQSNDWGLWLTTLHCLGPSLVEGLPLVLTPVGEPWRGLQQYSVDSTPDQDWRGIAFRESGMAMVTGSGLTAVGGAFGCEFSDGHGIVAVVGASKVASWVLEGARSAPTESVFRLRNTQGTRFIVTGRQGRLVLISECNQARHQLLIEIGDGVIDEGPQKHGNTRVGIALDRRAAWRWTGGQWRGEFGCVDIPNRLRISFSPKSP